jgi:hypothetical protein
VKLRFILAKQIKRGHHSYPAPMGAWVWAINTILERRDQGKLQLPFKNHGYLYEVITSYKPEYAPVQEAKLRPSHAASQAARAKQMLNVQSIRLNMSAKSMNVQQSHFQNYLKKPMKSEKL